MQIARVIGSAVSTVKDPKLTGLKLLVVQKASPDNQVYGDAFIAADTVGAGEGELVMLVEGSSSRYTGKTLDIAIDAVIIGILDSLEVDGDTVFRKS
jgi:ethanolamine utilization protein EutN